MTYDSWQIELNVTNFVSSLIEFLIKLMFKVKTDMSVADLTKLPEIFRIFPQPNFIV